MSWQSALACWIVRRRLRPETAKPVIDVARARAYAARRVWTPKVPAGWHLTERNDANDFPLRGEWLTADAEPRQTTILYFHGGGYYFCSPRSHRSVVFALATRANARTFSLDYRLAPEHRFPCALDDAVCRLPSLARRRRSRAVDRHRWRFRRRRSRARDAACVARRSAIRCQRAPFCFHRGRTWRRRARSIVTNDGRDPMFHGAALARAAKVYLGDADRDASLRVAALWPLRRFAAALDPGGRHGSLARRRHARRRKSACGRRDRRLRDLAERAARLPVVRAVHAGGEPCAGPRRRFHPRRDGERDGSAAAAKSSIV